MNQQVSQLTAAQRAELARRLRQGGSDEPVLHRQPGGTATSPLGLDQQRLWLLEELDPNGTTYNISVGLRFRGALDVAALASAAGDVVRHHELLRTTMHEDRGEPYMRVHDDLPPGFEVVDLRVVPADRREDALAPRIRAHTGMQFDLTTGPLLRILVVQLDERDYQIVETMHHSITDQWSYVRLNAQLVECYQARVEQRPAALPDLPVQFGDFARWQRQWHAGARRERYQTFWREYLAGAPSLLDLPYDASPDTASRVGAHHYFRVSDEVGAAFIQLARSARMTLASALLAVYGGLLYVETGRCDLVIGVPSATRRPETENLIGFLLTTVPMRLQFPPHPTPRDLLDAAARAAAAVAEYRDVPFSEIVEAAAPERSAHRYPLVQTMHLVLDFEESIFEVPGAEVYGTEVEDGVSPMDITVGWWHTRGTLYGRLEYRTALFHQSTVERLTSRLLRLLERFGASGDTPLMPEARSAFAATARVESPPSAVAAPPEAVRQVHRAWATVLGQEPSGAEASFFEAGGTSILAVRFAHELRAAGLEASARDVHVFPRPAALAAALASRGQNPGGDAEQLGGPPWPLSAEQEDLLSFEPDQPSRWTHSVVLHTHGPLDAERLRTAVEACVAAHPALTSRFVATKDGRSVDLGGGWYWSVEAPDADDAHTVDAHVARFDLAAGPLFAASVVPAPTGARLVLTANHLVVDGVSWMVLVKDLAMAYRGKALVPERGSYGAYSAALRKADLSAELPFWQSQLSGPAGGNYETLLADEREVVVTASGPADGAAVRTATLACAARGLARLFGEHRDLVVDVVAHGREPVGDPAGYDLDRGVGYYACAYPLRLSVDPDGGVAATVAAATVALDSVPNGGKGWGWLNSSASPAARAMRTGHRRPLAAVNQLGESTALHHLSGGLFTHTTEVARRAYPGARRDHLVTVLTSVEPDRLVMRWQYDGRRYAAERVRAVAEWAISDLPAALAAATAPATASESAGTSGLDIAGVNEMFAELYRKTR